MSIEFDALADIPYQGSMQIVLPRVRTLLAADYMTGVRIELPPLRTDAIGSAFEETPQFMGLDALLSPGVSLQFSGFYTATGTFDLTLPQLRSALYSGTRMALDLPPLGLYSTSSQPVFIAPDINVDVQMAAQYEAPIVNETLLMTFETTASWAVILEAVFSASDSLSLIAKLRATIEDSFVARDTFTVVLQAVLTDEVVLDFQNTAVLRMVYLLADQITINDEAVGFYNALVTIVSAMVLADQVTPGIDGTLLSEFQIDDEMQAQIRMIVEMVSELALKDSFEPSLHLFAAVEDQVQFASDMVSTVAMLAEILDTASIGFRVMTEEGDVYIGYSMNTRNAATTEYDNYPFSSMAIIGGVPFGTGPDGIYRLNGDDDDGAPINASMYTGLTDFGSSYLKKLPAAWIGLTSDGEMVLKVITTDKGRKKENWYRMKARPQGAPVDSRFTPAKGLEGRYWGFKIENTNGADFQIDSIKLWPLVMKRRYSGR